MKLKVISIFNWRGKVWQVGDTFDVDDKKGQMMLREGYVTLDSPVEVQATEQKSEPTVANEVLAGDQNQEPTVKSKKKQKRR